MNFPRIMFAATKSGSGKTLITCAVIKLLMNKGLKVSSFKCGPDYIDPMFHSKVLGAKSRNLDTFFTNKKTTVDLFCQNAFNSNISVMEGVMGYYDGIAGLSTSSSSYEVSKYTHTPVVLIVDCQGMSLSILSVIKGFLSYKENSNIKAVILNRISKSLYPRIKTEIESQLNLQVLGYLPVLNESFLVNRHLGLVTPDEILNIREKIDELSETAGKTIDIDKIIKLSLSAQDIDYLPVKKNIEPILKIALALDKAFSFYYEDDLNLLRSLGADIVPFSPMNDRVLPKDISGIIIGGGYPELHLDTLSKNASMINDIRQKYATGMPIIAECGGFMFLHENMEDINKNIYKTLDIIKGTAFKTDSLKRFGYVTLTANEDNMLCKKGESIKGHEFHYWDSNNLGESFTMTKPLVSTSWQGIHAKENIFAGFAHIYLNSNLSFAKNFIGKCKKFGGDISA